MELGDSSGDEQHIEGKELKGISSRTDGIEFNEEDCITVEPQSDGGEAQQEAPSPTSEDENRLDALDKNTSQAQFTLMMDEREFQAEMDAIDKRIQGEVDERRNTSILQTIELLLRDFGSPSDAQLLANFQADILVAPAEDLAELFKAGDSEQSVEIGQAIQELLRVAEQMGEVFELSEDKDGDIMSEFKESMVYAPLAEIYTLSSSRFADILPLTLELGIPEDVQALVEEYASEHPFYTATGINEDAEEEFRSDVKAFAMAAGLGTHTADLMARMAMSTWHGEQTLRESNEPTWD
jgi:hypothetical protein